MNRKMHLSLILWCGELFSIFCQNEKRIGVESELFELHKH